MRLFRKPVSDAEYVEQLRKALRVQRWTRRWHALTGLAMVLLSAYGIYVLVQMLANLAAGPAQRNLAIGLFSVAIIMGLTVGFWLSHAAHSFVRSLVEPRSERMLVTLWDALADDLKDCPGQRH